VRQGVRAQSLRARTSGGRDGTSPVAGRVPYRKHRYDVAAYFGVDESYIWPDALDNEQVVAASESEVVAVYPYRRAVPRDAWGHLFGQAEKEIGILAYSCYFLAEDAGLRQLIGEKAESGVRVRILRRHQYHARQAHRRWHAYAGKLPRITNCHCRI
jgi:hypothetical protein